MMIRGDLIFKPPVTLMKVLCVFVVFFVISESVVSKEKSVGSVVRVVGAVSATGVDGETRKLRIQQEVYSGDRLVTDKGSWLTVNFYDLTRIVLRPESEFYIRSFPITMDAGDIDLKVVRGGVRITSGTIASQSHERFLLSTPNGSLHAGRAEWVVRVCNGQSCEAEHSAIKQCKKYKKTMVKDTEIISVYQGQVRINNCIGISAVEQGSSIINDTQTQRCDVIDQVPCFVLFDGKMGKDKLRIYLEKLTLNEVPEIKIDENQSKEELRPESRSSRPSSRTRRTTPSIDRPRRSRR